MVSGFFEHGASDERETIGNTCKGAAMAMTALAQFGVAGAAAGVVLDGDAGPMVDSGAQPQMTGLAHENHAALTAAPRHRGNTRQSAQRMIISLAQRSAASPLRSCCRSSAMRDH